ncbi:hypothetical protein LTR95_006940 [Oleoguttula sp. CCFEE 5521]
MEVSLRRQRPDPASDAALKAPNKRQRQQAIPHESSPQVQYGQQFLLTNDLPHLQSSNMAHHAAAFQQA